MELKKDISKYKDAHARVSRSLCKQCGVCKTDENGRIRKINCADKVNLKIIYEAIEKLEKEWTNDC